MERRRHNRFLRQFSTKKLAHQAWIRFEFVPWLSFSCSLEIIRLANEFIESLPEHRDGNSVTIWENTIWNRIPRNRKRTQLASLSWAVVTNGHNNAARRQEADGVPDVMDVASSVVWRVHEDVGDTWKSTWYHFQEVTDDN